MGWLALLGGGEFSFGETLDADRAWLALCGPGPVGFVPAASGSNDYPRHFAAYLLEAFQRQVETLPIYRPRDARRGRNAERIAQVAAVYLGGGVTDHLLEALAGSPAADALAARLAAGEVPGSGRAAAGGAGGARDSGIGGEGSTAGAAGGPGAGGGRGGAGAGGTDGRETAAAGTGGGRTGGMVVAIAAAAQAAGLWARSIAPGRTMAGFGWLPDGVVEPNFDPGHDRRLRRLMAQPGVRWGLGLPAGSAVLLGAAARRGPGVQAEPRGAGDTAGPNASGGAAPVPRAVPAEGVHVAGTIFRLRGPDDDLEVLESGAAW